MPQSKCQAPVVSFQGHLHPGVIFRVIRTIEAFRGMIGRGLVEIWRDTKIKSRNGKISNSSCQGGQTIGILERKRAKEALRMSGSRTGGGGIRIKKMLVRKKLKWE